MKGRRRGAAAFGLIACSLLFMSSLASPLAADPSTSTTSSAAAIQGPSSLATSLALSVVPPDLPADGRTYPALVVSLQSSTGAPSIALNDTSVFLTSYLAGVGAVSDQVVIPRGEGFAVANFTTTTSPGTTTVSATSAGLNSSSVKVTTMAPSGVATRLDLIPVPSSSTVGASEAGIVMVETLDSSGLPAKTTSDLEVSLSSSDPDAASLPYGSLTVPSGSFLASAEYKVGLSPGVATIECSASGFAPSSATVTVEGLPAFALVMFAEPDPIPASTTGRLVVSLMDSAGDPVPAPAAVPVAISSSNTSVVSTGQSVTIPPGQIYAVASLGAGAAPGTANLTASSPGLMSAFAAVSVVEPAQPADLKLILAPNSILADNASYDSILVALTGANGGPAVASSGVSVTLTSSDAAVGQVSGTVTISTGGTYAVGTFSSTFAAGATVITALAQNLQSATATVDTYGASPTKLAVESLLPDLPADGGNYSAVAVMLEGANGDAAAAPTNTVVQLESESPGVAGVSPTATILAGQSYALADVSTTLSAGTANINASAPGFAPSGAEVVTSSPVPSQLGVYLAPAEAIHGLGAAVAILAVQLQGPGSYPSTALEDTQIAVSSSNSSVVGPLQLDVPAGSDYAWALVNSTEAGTSVLTAAASGFAPSGATLAEAPLPVSVSLTSSVPDIAIGGAATVTLQLQVLGTPVAGADVTITATSGSVTPQSGVTDSSGQFSGTFIPLQSGAAVVTASVQDPLSGNRTASVNIIVTPRGTGAPAASGLGLVASLLPIAVVVVIVAIIAFMVRRTVMARKGVAEQVESKDEDAS